MNRTYLASIIAGLLVASTASGQERRLAGELPPFPAQVRVVEVRPDGAVLPLVGADVWIIAEQVEPSMGRPKRTTVGRFPATTRVSGTAAWTKVRSIRDAVYSVSCVYGGVSYRSKEFRLGESPPPELRVYHSSTDTSDIRLSALYELTVSDTMLYVTQLVRVFNDSNTTVDFNYRPEGLRLPTLAFPVAGKVPVHGLFPLGKVHGTPEMTNGQGRIVGERGAVVYRGPVLPGSRSFVRFRYAIPFHHENVELAAVSDVPMRDASVIMTWTTLVQPILRLGHEVTARSRSRGHVNQLEVSLHEGLDAGSPLRIQLAHLPIRTDVPMKLATAGSFGLAFIFLAILVGAVWRRRTA